MQDADPLLYSYLKKSKAYFDGTRVLIDGGKTFRDFIRSNKESRRFIKTLILKTAGIAVPIGPYEPKAAAEAAAGSTAEQSLQALAERGLEVTIQDSEKRPDRR